jgi:nucleoside-diphosphate-sugar epimerase
MKRILVTGDRGFVGCELMRSLRNEQVHLYTIDKSAGVDSINLNEQDRLIEVFENFRPEIVIHLAAETDTKKVYDYLEDNVLALMNLINAINRFGVSKFIFTSSMLSEFLSEKFDVRTILYGRSKQIGEELIKMNCLCPYTILRPTLVYGENMNDYHERKFKVAAKLLTIFKFKRLGQKKSMCNVQVLATKILSELETTNKNIDWVCDDYLLSIENLILQKYDVNIPRVRIVVPDFFLLTILRFFSKKYYNAYLNAGLFYDYR